jgi:hypothetical protein
MVAITADEVRAAFDRPLIDAPARLQSFFAEAIYDLEGLDLALGFLAAGIVDEARERMRMWHKEYANLGYRGWAESYLGEVLRKNQFTLPNALTAEERSYLDRWRDSMRNLIERSSHAVA